MPSAAEKVFALPELLENILLNLKWRELFKVLRTNKTFHDTTMRSTKLRRRMHLEYKLPGEDRGIYIPYPLNCNSILHGLFVQGGFGLGPFTILEDSRGRDRLAGWPLKIIANCSISPTDGSVPSHIGMLTRVRPSKGAPAPSWRSMKITHEHESVGLKIVVDQHDDVEYFHYKEEFEFKAGEGTLGDIVDVMDSIRNRTRKQHRDRRPDLLEIWAKERGLPTTYETLGAQIELEDASSESEEVSSDSEEASSQP